MCLTLTTIWKLFSEFPFKKVDLEIKPLEIPSVVVISDIVRDIFQGRVVAHNMLQNESSKYQRGSDWNLWKPK